MHGQAPRYRRKCAPASLVVARRGREVDHAEGVLEDWTVHSAFGGAIACNSPGAERIALTAPEGLSSHEAFASTLAHEQIHSNASS
jgi:antirestriction protein ArdC